MLALSGQVGSVSNVSVGIGGQSHVQFRDVDLDAQRREARNVGGDAVDVGIEIVDVHLQANAVDGDASLLKVSNHREIASDFPLMVSASASL